jgi:predicted DsbA family dithiol-disulfide isomerase
VIEVFADISCPFTHVGLRRFVDRRDALGSDEQLHVKAWPLELIDEAPLAASAVADKNTELRRRVAPDLFTKFDATTFPTTTLPALRLAAAAYRVDAHRGEQVSLALRHALFEEGHDVSSPQVLAQLAGAHDVRPGPLDDEQVLSEWREGQRRGVEGSPYFFVKGEGFFCPSLDIRHIGSRLQIRQADEDLERFLVLALG